MPGTAPTRRRVRERPRLRALAALLASLALNALVARWLVDAGAFARPRPGDRTEVALAPIAPGAWEANRAVRPPTPRGRVVELPPEQPASDRPPDDARFLADRDAAVERETVSRDAGRYPRLAPRREPGAAAARGARVAGRSAPATADARSGPARPRKGDRVSATRPGLPLRAAPEGERSTGDPLAAGPPSPGPAPRGPPDLRPSAESLARIAGGPGMDGYREVEEGDETWLASREFRFATFLNQMRRAIAEFWYPSVERAIRERDPEGTDVFYRERTVVLHLTLDRSGSVRRLSIAESSDVAFVDEVALEAVRAAQPFANPPRAMFGDGGEARVPFAFTVFPFERKGVVRWSAPVGR